MSLLVPVFVDFLFEYYNTIENFPAVMTIADLIADENSRLFRFFDQPTLQQILQYFEKAAINNLRSGSYDPIGILSPFEGNFPHYT